MNSEKNTQLAKECAAYFKGKSIYQKIFEQMQKNWKKFGRVSGSIKLSTASQAEQQEVGGFLGKDFVEGKLVFKMANFERALTETRFAGITMEQLLEAYFGGRLVQNKVAAEQKRKNRIEFLDLLCNRMVSKYGQDSQSVRWFLELVRRKKYGYRMVPEEYSTVGQAAAEQLVISVGEALHYLEQRSGKMIRLAMLGAELTLNPHAFDRQTVAGKLLIQALSFLYNEASIQSAEAILMIYYQAGIKPDDISSFTTAYGIKLYTNAGEHMAYHEFIQSKEPYVVTLSNLGRIIRAECSNRVVFSIENQMVFSHICEEMAGKEVALLCTSGQMKTASLVMIDLLCEAGYQIYYSGDFDPEGLQIADKVLERNERCVPWRLSVQDYYHCLSKEVISEQRLKKLDSVQDERLLEVCRLLREKKYAGYQERLVEYMVKDIQEKLDITKVVQINTEEG